MHQAHAVAGDGQPAAQRIGLGLDLLFGDADLFLGPGELRFEGADIPRPAYWGGLSWHMPQRLPVT